MFGSHGGLNVISRLTVLILLECSNLPPYSQRLREETGLPIFDLIGFVNLVHNAVVKNRFEGFL